MTQVKSVKSNSEISAGMIPQRPGTHSNGARMPYFMHFTAVYANATRAMVPAFVLRPARCHSLT